MLTGAAAGHSGAAVNAGGTVVSLHRLAKIYEARSGSLPALHDIDLDIPSGQFVCVLGPSGCGKSTILNIIAGLIPHSTGTVTVLGRPVIEPVTDVGIVFQRDLLLPWRSALGNVMLQAEIRRLPLAPLEKRAKDLLQLVGLGEFAAMHPQELSGGMRQRVSICRALVHNPSLLLMDEPFGALDAMTRDQMNLDILRIWERNSKTVVFVTHSITEAVFLADRVIVMSPRPGTIKADLRINLPRPRHLAIREAPEFIQYTRTIRLLFQDMGLLHEDVERPDASKALS
jgi:NitT/TauT family transport system ATP-binding protein